MEFVLSEPYNRAMTTTRNHAESGLNSRLASPLDPLTARVSVVIPTRNEAGHIDATLRSVLHQTFPLERMDVVVVDGMSEDGTRALVERLQSKVPQMRIMDNPARVTPSALNIGIEATGGDVIVRVDGHTQITPSYVERCVELLARSRAANVGGLMRPRGDGLVSRAVSCAMRSRFGVGNARFHYLEREEYVDTVYLGAFRREVLEEVSGFDEELIRNQDDELNFRIRAAGYGILLSPDIVSTYTPRGSIRALWRQFYGYGWWKVRVIEKHPDSVQIRHLAPPALVAGLLGSLMGYVLNRKPLLLLPVLIYLAGTLVASLRAAEDSRLAPVLLLVFPCMHIGYGSGFLVALGPSLRRGSFPIRSVVPAFG